MMNLLQPALSTAGILLSLIGVCILFYYGFPQPAHEEGVGLGLEDGTQLPNGRTVKEQNEEIRATKQKYIFWSRWALALIVIGSFMQVVSAWL